VSAPAGVAFAHVAFDLDGTLVDSRADLAAAVNRVRTELGLPAIAAGMVARWVGDGARVLVERALGPDRAGDVPHGLALFMEYYGAHLLDATRPYPGVPEALAALADRGVVLSVLSNKPVAMSRAILDGLGLGARFRAVLGGDSLPARKPDPAGVEHLAAGAGTPRERMLLVGDSPIDLRTAAAAGVAFCGVAWGFASEALRAARPARMIEHPAALVDVVCGGPAGQDARQTSS
jgi:phosphoglycolate phosphatase